MDLPEFVLADSLWPADLAQLADIEAQSRAAGGETYTQALTDYDRVLARHPLAATAAFRRATQIALRLYPDEERIMLAAEALAQAVLTRSRFEREFDAETRMYLGRSFRKWREGLTSA